MWPTIISVLPEATTVVRFLTAAVCLLIAVRRWRGRR